MGSFWASDNTCENCLAGYQSSSIRRELMGKIGTQAERARIPLADGTLGRRSPWSSARQIVEERGDEGVARIKELTGGFRAHSTIEAVGTRESVMQAIHSTRPGGHVGFVGVLHDVDLPDEELFYSQVHLHGGPAHASAPSCLSSST